MEILLVPPELFSKRILFICKYLAEVAAEVTFLLESISSKYPKHMHGIEDRYSALGSVDSSSISRTEIMVIISLCFLLLKPI